MPDPADGPAPIYRFGEFELDLGRRVLCRDGSRVELQRKPLQLLLYLVQHRDRVIPKEELLDQVWPGVVVSDDALTSALRHIRTALGDERRSPGFVENLRGHGYRFIAELEEVSPVDEAAPARSRRSTLAAALTAAVAIAVAAWLGLRDETPEDVLLARPAIAVLRFENLSGDPDQEYFAAGITRDLITRLARWRSFPVIAPRTSSFRNQGTPVEVKQMSEELRYVVGGSVQKADRRLRINVQLIDASTGHYVWAEHYDRDLEDTLLVQDEITDAIVGAMHPELLRFERQRARRADPDQLAAWDLVQRGNWHFYRYNREDMAQALALFQRAAQLDPGSARAYVGQSRAHDREFQHRWTDVPDEALRQSLEAARRAVEFDPADPWAHRQLGVALAFSGDRRGYRAGLRRALELDPSGADFHCNYAMSQVSVDVNAAITSAETGLRLSPRDPALQHTCLLALGAAQLQAHRYGQASESLRRAIESPTGGFVDFGQLHLAAALAQQGRLEEAHIELEELSERTPGLSTLEGVLARYPNQSDSLMDGLRKAGVPES